MVLRRDVCSNWTSDDDAPEKLVGQQVGQDVKK